jgi:histidine triad (HIT) family protein
VKRKIFWLNLSQNLFWKHITHIVVITKRNISLLLALEKEDETLFLELFDVIQKVAEKVVREKDKVRVLTNLGEYQESKHLHFYFNSGKQIRLNNFIR